MQGMVKLRQHERQTLWLHQILCNEDTVQITPIGSLFLNSVKQWLFNEPPMAVHGLFFEIARKDITCG